MFNCGTFDCGNCLRYFIILRDLFQLTELVAQEGATPHLHGPQKKQFGEKSKNLKKQAG